MEALVTPKQVAQAIGVSESSLKRWCDRGILKTVRTAGGHRRLELADVVQFLRATGREAVRPSLIGLPSTAGRGETALTRVGQQFCEALVAGDVEACRRIVFDLHLSGRSVSALCDTVIAESMHEIGERWECGEAEVYQERRATMLCLRVLSELRSVIPAADATAPVAIGGTPEGDSYLIASLMAEIVLRQQGWQVQSLGSSLPFSTLAAAIRDVRPQLFWLSVSQIDDADRFVVDYQAFYDAVRNDVPVVVGGRALTEQMRRQMEYAAFGDTMQHLESFSETLKRSLETTSLTE